MFKLTALLGYGCELLVAAAIFENLVFDGERSNLLVASCFLLVLLALAATFARGAFQVSVLTPLINIPLLGFQIALSISEFWHDKLAGEYGSIFSGPDLLAVAVILILFLLEFLCLRKIGRSLFICCVTFIWILNESTNIAGEPFFTFNLKETLLNIPFVLPLVIYLVALLTKDELIAQRHRIPKLFATFVSLSFVVAITQAYTETTISTSSNLKVSAPNPILVPLLISEDPIFFKHRGVDYSRLKEAARDTIESGQFVRGGSTLSMQLFKVLSGDYDKSLWRKFSQTIGAIFFEQAKSKKEILFKYLESVSFGPAVIGLQEASRHYFNCSPDELTEAQAYKLVLTIYNPVNYTPAAQKVPREAQLRLAVIVSRQAEIGERLKAELARL